MSCGYSLREEGKVRLMNKDVQHMHSCNSKNFTCHFAFYCRYTVFDHVTVIDHPHANKYSRTYVWKLVFSFSIILFSHILKARLIKSLLEGIHLRKGKEIYHF